MMYMEFVPRIVISISCYLPIESEGHFWYKKMASNTVLTCPYLSPPQWPVWIDEKVKHGDIGGGLLDETWWGDEETRAKNKPINGYVDYE